MDKMLMDYKKCLCMVSKLLCMKMRKYTIWCKCMLNADKNLKGGVEMEMNCNDEWIKKMLKARIKTMTL